MNIRSTQIPVSSPFTPASVTVKADSSAPAQSALPQEDFVSSSNAFFSADKLKSFAVIGGVSLVGAAIGAVGGNFTGAIGGIAGAVAGAAGGVAAATALPGEKIKTGLMLGAIGGAIAGSSYGNTGMTVGLGLAGATLPYSVLIAAFAIK